ncbi:MAG TPA: FAD/NAD(P)-binding oxidoreductase, partial [Thermomonas sp.]|nr:FAD/NAD(P)-binding oxidoreductase [Thermomonas sp.]
MARIVVMGAGLGGMSAAYELRETLGKGHDIVLVGLGESFGFTPSNPWLAVGWRKQEEITLPVADHVGKHGIRFDGSGVAHIDAASDAVITGSGERIGYDYLLICTGPRLAFEEVPGTGPHGGYTQSVCTTPHAAQAWEAYQEFLKNPGPVVIGAVAGASCFGPAYEFAMIVDADLRKRKLRDK